MVSATALGAVGRGFESLYSDRDLQHQLKVPFLYLGKRGYQMFFSAIYWDSDPVAFYIPFIQHPVAWYGIIFVTGFLIAYILTRKLIRIRLQEETSLDESAILTESTLLLDQLTWYVVLATLVGARLGHMLFYDLDKLIQDPLVVFRTWEGGLASHGGAFAIILALYLFSRRHRPHYPFLTWTFLLDLLAVPTAFVGGCIRIGNFINQEIVGIPTQVPWAITFLHPMEGVAPVPRHPVQLYEAAFYFATFALLWGLWTKKPHLSHQKGFFIGLFMILVFGFRIFVEFFKIHQSVLLSDSSFWHMGQLLSFPFVALGCFTLWRSYRQYSQ